MGFCAAMMLRFCALLVTVWAASGENSCPRGAGPTCKGANKAEVASGSGTAVTPPTADLITQEVDQLQSSVKLIDERIKLLQEMKQMVGSGAELGSDMRMLREQLPLMSEVALPTDMAPTGSADDYLLSKVVIPQETPVSFIKFLTLRSPRSGGGSSSSPGQLAMPSVLLVAVQADGSVRLFSPAGELVLTFSLGHEHPVTHLAVSQSQDEYTVLTADTGGVIRVNKINMRQRRLTKEQKKELRESVDEKQSQFLGAAVNVTAQFIKQMQVPPGSDGETSKVTALSLATHQGTKYFVSGDTEGKINIFTKNGTFTVGLDATVTPGTHVTALYSHLSNLIFRTGGGEWGFVDLGRQEVNRLDCPGFDGHVTAVVIDSQQAQRLLVADAEGTVWVLNVKEKRHCKVEHTFPKGTTHSLIDLASVKGYTIALQRGEEDEVSSISALNMSHVGRRTEALMELPSAVVWRRQQGIRDWSVHKRFQQGDLLALLSEDGLKIELLELLMTVYQAPSSTDAMGNFKMPMIGVAVLLVLGYQYMRSKGKGGGGGGKKDMSNFDMSAFKNKTMSGKKGLGGALGGLAGLRNKGKAGRR